MKVISLFTIILFVVVVTANNDPIRTRFRTAVFECREETKASSNDVKEMVNHKPPSTRVGKCFRACIMRKFGLMDRNGRINRRVALQLVSILLRGDEKRMKDAEEIIDICRRIRVPGDICETTHRYEVCLRKESKKRGIDVVKLFSPVIGNSG